jgi:hypothetical protein
MSIASLKKLLSENGIVAFIVLIVALYFFNSFYKYFYGKSVYSESEGADNMAKEYKNSPDRANSEAVANVAPATVGIQAAEEKPNDYANINEIQSMAPQSGVADSSALLPKDGNNQWAQLSPAGSGDLQGINLLQAGYHIGIDTIGQTLRNANLQIRSEPPNPQMNVGPWNQTTISPDLMRVPLELGCGGQ